LLQVNSAHPASRAALHMLAQNAVGIGFVAVPLRPVILEPGDHIGIEPQAPSASPRTA